MLCRRVNPISLLIVVTISLCLAPLAAAQDEGVEPIGTINFGMTATALEDPSVVADDFPPESTFFQLAESGGGSVVPCGTGGPASADYVWVSGPLVENAEDAPATLLGNGTFTLGFAADGAPQPIAQGDVTLTLKTGYKGAGNVHGHSLVPSDAITVSPQAPVGGAALPGGALPASASYPVTYTDSGLALPAGALFTIHLNVACAGPADFSLTFDSFPDADYVWGTPGASDMDGDGFPDEFDSDADGDGFTEAEENAVGTSDADAGSNPAMDADGDGFTLEEEFGAGTSDDDADDFPGAGGFPWLLVILVVLGLLLVGGLVFGAMTVLGKNLEVEVSDDGFKAIDKGTTAAYDVDVYATGKKEGTLDVELTLKGVPDDWHATIEPHHLQLAQGAEEPEVQTAILTITPPADQEYEDEAVVTVSATPVDEEGKSSALKPGASAKTKTIVNIGVTPPEGEGRKKKKAKKDDDEPAEEAATAEQGDVDKPKKRFGGGLLKRKQKDGEDEAADEATAEEGEATAEPVEAEPTTAPEETGAAAAAGKPSIAMGKMVHDPADFSAGDEVTTTVNVRNKGDGPVEGLRLSLFVNDERADQQVVDLEAGASEEVTFNWTARPDENRVRIKGGLKGA